MEEKSTRPKHRDWLIVAYSDLIAATKLVDDAQTLAPSIFHTQQCAEKALKAFLGFHKEEIKRTHNLAELIKDCIKHDPEFNELVPAIFELNPYSTTTRYPDNNLFLPYRPLVEEAIVHAESILNFVKNKIEKE